MRIHTNQKIYFDLVKWIRTTQWILLKRVLINNRPRPRSSFFVDGIDAGLSSLQTNDIILNPCHISERSVQYNYFMSLYGFQAIRPKVKFGLRLEFEWCVCAPRWQNVLSLAMEQSHEDVQFNLIHRSFLYSPPLEKVLYGRAL